VRHLRRSYERLFKCASGGRRKINPREAHNLFVQTAVQLLLCCPRRVRFLQYELRLDYRQASTGGQRGRDAYSPIERVPDLQPQYWPRPHGRQYPMNWQRKIIGSAPERLQISCDLVEICCGSLVIVFRFSCANFTRIPVTPAIDASGAIGQSTVHKACINLAQILLRTCSYLAKCLQNPCFLGCSQAHRRPPHRRLMARPKTSITPKRFLPHADTSTRTGM
jgi:hypothetical protein